MMKIPNGSMIITSVVNFENKFLNVKSSDTLASKRAFIVLGVLCTYVSCKDCIDFITDKGVLSMCFKKRNVKKRKNVYSIDW